MNTLRRFIGITLCSILPLSLVTPSWAHGGRGGFGWGWWGAAAALTVAAATSPLWYPGYPYDPYYYGPYNGYPYAYPPRPAPYPVSAGTGSSSGAAPLTDDQIAQSRERVEFAYADGDISKSERDARMSTLDQLAKSPRSPVATEPSSQATVQSPGSSRRDLTAIDDLQLELSTLLDSKLKDGSITRAQFDAEQSILVRIKNATQAEASANGGTLSAERESALVQQMHHAYYVISHNFVGQ